MTPSTSTNRELGECPACKSEQIDQSIAEVNAVCNGCGVVIHDVTDPAPPDWIVTDTDSSSSESGEWLDNCRIRNATEKRVAQAFDTLEDLADQVEAGHEIRVETSKIYCDAVLAEITSGRETPSLVAACLRLASTCLDQPVPQSRLTELSSVDVQKFRRSLSVLQDEVSEEVPTVSPSDYIPFLERALDLTAPQTRDTEQALREVESEPELAGKDPAGVAAAGAYMVVEDATQATVATAVGVSTETIRVRTAQYRELLDDA